MYVLLPIDSKTVQVIADSSIYDSLKWKNADPESPKIWIVGMLGCFYSCWCLERLSVFGIIFSNWYKKKNDDPESPKIWIVAMQGCFYSCWCWERKIISIWHNTFQINIPVNIPKMLPGLNCWTVGDVCISFEWCWCLYCFWIYLMFEKDWQYCSNTLPAYCKCDKTDDTLLQ